MLDNVLQLRQGYVLTSPIFGEGYIFEEGYRHVVANEA